jgi:hypothetical protein
MARVGAVGPNALRWRSLFSSENILQIKGKQGYLHGYIAFYNREVRERETKRLFRWLCASTRFPWKKQLRAITQ